MMGLGRGVVRSMDHGGRMGRCTGHGIGRIHRMLIRTDLNKGYFPIVSQVASPSESDVDREQVETFMREQAQVLEEQKYEVEQRIRGLETGLNLVAVVLPEECAGCGICVDVCPANAIEVSEYAVISAEVCVGCGDCLSECPNDAIILTPAENQ